MKVYWGLDLESGKRRLNVTTAVRRLPHRSDAGASRLDQSFIYRGAHCMLLCSDCLVLTRVITEYPGPLSSESPCISLIRSVLVLHLASAPKTLHSAPRPFVIVCMSCGSLYSTLTARGAPDVGALIIWRVAFYV
ncbi:hypothetical protein AOLI_G00153760 [Acnodon oligacanthus]